MAQTYNIADNAALEALFASNTLVDGDVIKLAAGTYSYGANITKGVTIEGPNATLLGSASGRAAEAIITGQWKIDSATKVVITGVKFFDADTGTSFNALTVKAAGSDVQHEILNSVFMRAQGAAPSTGHYAVNLEDMAGGVKIAGNLFTSQVSGTPAAGYLYQNGIWTRGIQASSSIGVVDILNNDFQNLRNAINTSSAFDNDWTISGNNFANVATGLTIAGANASSFTKITGNVFGDGIDAELNIKHADTAVNLSTLDVSQFEAEDGVYILAGTKIGDVAVFNDPITSLTPFHKWDDGAGWLINYTDLYTPTGTNADIPHLIDQNMVVGAEKVVANNKTFLLVGSGGYATIGAAIEAANPGDTIRVAAGTYNENLVIAKADITIIGDGDATIIQGTGAASSIGVNIQASGFTLQDVKISNFHYNARATADANDIVIDDVTFSGGNIGFGKATETDINGLTIKDSAFENLTIGMDLPTAKLQGRITGFDVQDSTFTNISFKGIYVEAASGALFKDLTMTNVGNFGGSDASQLGMHGTGIDLNLKYANYTDIIIRNFDLTNVGLSNRNGADTSSHANGAGISVKVRDDAPSYDAPDAASFTGSILIENGTINGTSTGIRAGEAGKVTVGAPIDIRDVTISNYQVTNGHGSLANATTNTITVDTSFSDIGAGNGYIDDGENVITVGATGANYTTVSEALAVAHQGDTIRLLSGEFTEPVTITKGVNIVGAADNASVIKGSWTINTTQQVKIDGLTFLDDRAYTLSDSDNYVALKILQHSTATGGHTIENSVFDRDPTTNPGSFNPTQFAGSASQPTHRAIEIAAVADGAEVTIQGNTFTGGNTYPYAGDNWRTAVYSNGGAGQTNITGNTFENVRSGINADNFGPTVVIEDNQFSNSGTAISLQSNSTSNQVVSTIEGNTFGAGVDAEINAKAMAGGVTFIGDNNYSTQDTTYFLGSATKVDSFIHDGPVMSISTAVTSDGVGWAINGGTGQPSTVVVNVESVSVGTHKILFVGSGGYSTIQAAIDAAEDGDIVKIAPGTYTEKVIVDVPNLTIEGSTGTVIKGTFNANNGNFAGDLSDWIGTAPSYNGAADAGVTVKAGGFTLKEVTIDDFLHGVKFDTDVANVALVDVNITNTVMGLHKTATADVDGLTVTRGSIVDGYQGTDFQKNTTDAADGHLKNVTIDGTLFQDLTAKGIYTETLSNAVIRNITMTDVAMFGRGDPFGDIGEHGGGIDINLKAGAYSSIRIEDFIFTNVGKSVGTGTTSHFNAGAITIKARTDGSYAAIPATYPGSITIEDGTITGTSTGVRVGEYQAGGNVVTGTGINLLIQRLAITGETTTGGHGDFVNKTTATITVPYTGLQPSYSLGDGSNLIIFQNNNPPPVDTGPVTPPPPNPGQGQGPQTPVEQVGAGFGGSTGVDPTSEKATKPTIVLPSGEEVPNKIYEQAQKLTELTAKLEAGEITEEEVVDVMVEFATETTAVALQAYQFFTGATPTQEGVAYLVNSDDNPNDLTDPYYATFSPDNRYINFAVSLGTGGQGSSEFAQEYGPLSFEDSIRSAYDKIIGLDNARAAGIDLEAAFAYIMAQQAYFLALGGGDVGAKAAMVGYLMYAGMTAKVGAYYQGTKAFVASTLHGEAEYNVDLTGHAGSSGFSSAGFDLDWA